MEEIVMIIIKIGKIRIIVKRECLFKFNKNAEKTVLKYVDARIKFDNK